MIRYLIARILYAIPILLAINALTFALFFMVNSTDNMARMHLGGKNVTTEQIMLWKKNHGYDKPLFWNEEAEGRHHLTETLFYVESLRLMTFDFGDSDSGESIIDNIIQRAPPSLLLAIPTFVLGFICHVGFAFFLTMFRFTRFDRFSIMLCTLSMSISALFFIIVGQAFFAIYLKWFPISGYHDGWIATRFLFLPVLIGIVGGFGSNVRWYRNLFLNEVSQAYVLTARAKGVSEWNILRKHVFPNALIPILTGVVVVIPLLFLGSLLMESFFAIPGLGSYTIDAIGAQDFAIVRAMVYIGSIFYLIGLVLTDLTYGLVDPRIQLGANGS